MAVLSDAVDPATGSGPHARGGCPGSALGRLVVVLVGVWFLWGDARPRRAPGTDGRPTPTRPPGQGRRRGRLAESAVREAVGGRQEAALVGLQQQLVGQHLVRDRDR